MLTNTLTTLRRIFTFLTFKHIDLNTQPPIPNTHYTLPNSKYTLPKSGSRTQTAVLLGWAWIDKYFHKKKQFKTRLVFLIAKSTPLTLPVPGHVIPGPLDQDQDQ